MTATLEGGVSGQQHAPAALTPGKDPLPILQEVWWAPGPVWTGRKSRPNRDSFSDRSAIRYTDWDTLPTILLILHVIRTSTTLTSFQSPKSKSITARFWTALKDGFLSLERAAGEVGLRINEEKTKYLATRESKNKQRYFKIKNFKLHYYS